jgi:hypothetical protein
MSIFDIFDKSGENKKAYKSTIYRLLTSFKLLLGGEGGIRTLGTVSRTSV